MDKPLVSFVVPCYNYGRYLPDCLDGIYGQAGGYDLEVIAIDDCSTDNTREILQSYVPRGLRVILHEINRGHIYTVNEGLREARGKYVVRIDPDDRHRADFLATLVPLLEKHPDVGLAYSDVALIDGAGNLNASHCDSVHGGREYLGNELVEILQANFICAPTVIARREAWMQAWPVPEGLAFNDWYFNVMLARKWNFYYSPAVLAEYRVHGSNHHVKISADGTEEKSVLRVLDLVYSGVEDNPELERVKQGARGNIYAAQYMDFGRKYFGAGNRAAARRCLWSALGWNPRRALREKAVRYLLASYLPRAWYDGAKVALKNVTSA